ncbi:MAG TPA: hypothetical protein VGX25_23020 [Actinophytocola sp.]|uniref:hypothetical protein n=1 Tax=Actinophytocola sp. TaxID=1872138 RepID=UPI002DDD760F|nr:hypothetical protein [Actinophytocola sp.]HEV2782273.1 hypothetical protein [Actinophytocola sp.]
MDYLVIGARPAGHQLGQLPPIPGVETAAVNAPLDGGGRARCLGELPLNYLHGSDHVSADYRTVMSAAGGR